MTSARGPSAAEAGDPDDDPHQVVAGPARGRRARRRGSRLVKRCGAGGCALVVLFGAAYFVAIAQIRSRVSAAVRDGLGGELRGGIIWYVPMHGLVCVGPRVVRFGGDGGEIELFRADCVSIGVKAVPRAGKPLIIERLEIDRPTLTIDGSSARPASPTGAWPPGFRLSDYVQAHQVTIKNLSATYRSAGGGPVARVNDLSLSIEPPGGGGVAQPFSLTSRGPGYSIEATGRIDPDKLLMHVDAMSLTGEFRPSIAESPWAVVCPVLNGKDRVAGSVLIHAVGDVPLAHPRQASLDASVELRDVSGALPGLSDRLDRMNGRFALAKGGAADVGATLKVESISAGCGGVTLNVDSSELSVDPAWQTWKLANVSGRLDGERQFGLPATMPSSTLPYAGPRTAPAASAPEIVFAALPGTPAAVTRRIYVGGRVDFTASASGVMPGTGSGGAGSGGANAAGAGGAGGASGGGAGAGVHYEVLAFPRDATFQPRSFPLPLDHIGGGGSIRATDGTIALRNLTASYGGDAIALHWARIPLPADRTTWRLETRFEEIDARLTCKRPGPPYPGGLRRVFATLKPEGDFDIGNGRVTLAHDRPDGVHKTKDDFALDVSCDGAGSFMMTDRNILIRGLRGKAKLNNLQMDIGPVEGDALGGKVTGLLRILPRAGPTPARYSGELWAQSLDMGTVCRQFNLRKGEAPMVTGRGSGRVRLALDGAGGPRPIPQTITGTGEMEILGGNFWEDPIVGLVAQDVDHGKGRGAADAAAIFSIGDGMVKIDRAAINSLSIGMQGTGTIDFDREVDLQIVATPLGDLRDGLRKGGIPILSDLAAELAGGVQQALKTATGTLLYQYRITGPVDHPTKTVVPAPILSDPAATLFGKMAKAVQNPHLLDAVRSSNEKGTKREK